MKKRYIFFFFLLLSLVANAQDIVETTNGKRFDGYVTKEDPTAVYLKYKRDNITVDTVISRDDIRNVRLNIGFDDSKPGSHAKTALSIGAGLGSSTIAGVDFEYMVSKNVGVQAGAGYLGAGFGINYHFFPSIRSSYISLQYWCRGIGNDVDHGYKASLIGPAIVYRSKSWFTFQVGTGYILDKGPAYDDGNRNFKFGLTAGIGIYFPLSKK
ncbi:MAG: hypothetical protein P4L28_09805 [Paludibacteraceae bacterium]|nr:hypothetical protein [Paludibacteraceae bacterium]